jgi:hypothetical protein
MVWLAIEVGLAGKVGVAVGRAPAPPQATNDKRSTAAKTAERIGN